MFPAWPRLLTKVACVELPLGHAVRGLCGGMVVRICTYADMRLGKIRFRADGILDFRRLGILPQVVFTSYAARHRIFLS